MIELNMTFEEEEELDLSFRESQILPTLQGKSAYEIAVQNGFVGTEVQWLESLKGAPGTNGVNGKSAYELAVENSFVGTEEEWLESLNGQDGADGQNGINGKSAYEIAVQNGFVGTESQWLESLKGLGVTEEQIELWNSKSEFSGSYNDLTDKPTIPDAVSDEHINELIDAKLTPIEALVDDILGVI